MGNSYLDLGFVGDLFGGAFGLLATSNEAATRGYRNRGLFRQRFFFLLGRPRMAHRDDIRQEMRTNAAALKAERAKLVRKHPNAFVLMHHGKVCGIYASLKEAEAAGLKRYPNRMFSLHELAVHPKRVGSMARA